MGVARQHGARQATTRGHSHHQENCHKLLTGHGFEFDRQTSGTKNVYTHEDGRRIVVSATPRNPSVDLGYIRQQMTTPRQGIQSGTREGTMATTTAPSPTAPLVAMADPFLLKEPQGRVAQQARNAALAGWVKRVLERHGPLAPKILMDAGHELGFSDASLNRARKSAGAFAYTVPGQAIGKGKGQNPTWVGLSHQIPDGASVLGRSAPAPSEVQSEAQEPAEHPIGENNGAGPEPREEPAQAPDPIDWDGTGETAPLMPSESGLKTPMPARSFMHLDETVRTNDGDVGAAAQLLLSSLGLKTMDPEVAAWAQEAFNMLDRAQSDIRNAKTQLERIMRSMT